MAAQKPGERPNKPGEYVEVGPREGKVPNPRDATLKRGSKKVPPTQEAGRKWKRTGPPNP